MSNAADAGDEDTATESDEAEREAAGRRQTNCAAIAEIAANFQDTIKAISSLEKDVAELSKYFYSLKCELAAAQKCLENGKRYDGGHIIAVPQRAPSLPRVSWATVANTTARLTSSAEFLSIQSGGRPAFKTQQALHLSARSSAEQEAAAVSAKMRAHQEYRNAVKKKLFAAKRPRTGRQRVNVGADMLRAMYVVGMGGISFASSTSRRLSKTSRQSLESTTTGTAWDNVEILVHKYQYSDILRVLSDCLHQIREDYSPD